jgi:hypothetical protein
MQNAIVLKISPWNHPRHPNSCCKTLQEDSQCMADCPSCGFPSANKFDSSGGLHALGIHELAIEHIGIEKPGFGWHFALSNLFRS